MLKHSKRYGFSLIDLAIAMLIMGIALVGLLVTYISTLDLIETAKNTTYSVNSAQKKIEEIRDYTFSDIFTDYNGTNFSVDGISAGDSNGLVEVDNTNPELLVITVTVCWRQTNGRIVGGDASLNPLSNSPVRLVAYIANR